MQIRNWWQRLLKKKLDVSANMAMSKEVYVCLKAGFDGAFVVGGEELGVISLDWVWFKDGGS